jgi:pyrimidine-nucleoside phosphorylase
MIEAIESLKGKGPDDLLEVTLSLGSLMLILGGKINDFHKGRGLLLEKLKNREGLAKFKEMVLRQGGDTGIIEDYSLFPKTNYQMEVRSEKEGYVDSMDTKEIGLAAVELGAGREKLDSTVDLDVGMLIRKKTGERVSKNEELVKIFANDYHKGKRAEERVKKAFKIGKMKVKRIKKVLLAVDEKGVKKFSSA